MYDAVVQADPYDRELGVPPDGWMMSTDVGPVTAKLCVLATAGECNAKAPRNKSLRHGWPIDREAVRLAHEMAVRH